MVTAGVYSLFITVEDQIRRTIDEGEQQDAALFQLLLCLLAAYHFRLEFAHRLLTRRLCLIGLLNLLVQLADIVLQLHVQCLIPLAHLLQFAHHVGQPLPGVLQFIHHSRQEVGGPRRHQQTEEYRTHDIDNIDGAAQQHSNANLDGHSHHYDEERQK